MDWNKITIVLGLVSFGITLYQLAGGRQRRDLALGVLFASVILVCVALLVVAPPDDPKLISKQIEQVKRQGQDVLDALGRIRSQLAPVVHSEYAVSSKLVPLSQTSRSQNDDSIPKKQNYAMRKIKGGHGRIATEAGAYIKSKPTVASSLRHSEPPDALPLKTAMQNPDDGLSSKNFPSPVSPISTVIAWPTAGAQSASNSQHYRTGAELGGTDQLTLLKVAPAYPEEARRAKYSGTVTLLALITPEGRADNIRVEKRMGLGLDEAAIEALRKWRFRPGIKNHGDLVRRAVRVDMDFILQ